MGKKWNEWHEDGRQCGDDRCSCMTWPPKNSCACCEGEATLWYYEWGVHFCIALCDYCCLDKKSRNIESILRHTFRAVEELPEKIKELQELYAKMDEFDREIDMRFRRLYEDRK